MLEFKISAFKIFLHFFQTVPFLIKMLYYFPFCPPCGLQANVKRLFFKNKLLGAAGNMTSLMPPTSSCPSFNHHRKYAQISQYISKDLLIVLCTTTLVLLSNHAGTFMSCEDAFRVIVIKDSHYTLILLLLLARMHCRRTSWEKWMGK